jgi:single-strand DNA-binding protein
MNRVILMGRLTRDPEIRYSQSDNSMAIARYTLAVDRRGRRDQNNDNQQTADFIRCIAFGRSAEFAEKYMHQGMRMLVSGRIQTGSYTNKDGQTVYTTDVIVDDQEFADSKGAGAGNGGSYANNRSYNNNNSGSAYGHNGGSDDGSSIGDGFMNIPDGVEDEGLPFN